MRRIDKRMQSSSANSNQERAAVTVPKVWLPPEGKRAGRTIHASAGVTGRRDTDESGIVGFLFPRLTSYVKIGLNYAQGVHDASPEPAC